MDQLQQYLRETHDAGRLPNEADFEEFKIAPSNARTAHSLVHHAHYRGADGRPFTIAGPTHDDTRRRRYVEPSGARDSSQPTSSRSARAA